MTDDLVEMFAEAVEGFGARVESIRGDEWRSPTPDDEWDVRALVNHVLVEDLWAPPMLDGLTIADVGDRFDGDRLGDDPLAAWRDAATGAIGSAGRRGALEAVVHASFGDIPGREYVSQLVCDHVIHGWDLARGIGEDDRLDGDLVEFVWEYLSPKAGAWRAAGAFAPAVELPPGASRQAQLLALTGRRP